MNKLLISNEITGQNEVFSISQHLRICNNPSFKIHALLSFDIPCRLR